MAFSHRLVNQSLGADIRGRVSCKPAAAVLYLLPPAKEFPMSCASRGGAPATVSQPSTKSSSQTSSPSTSSASIPGAAAPDDGANVAAGAASSPSVEAAGAASAAAAASSVSPVHRKGRGGSRRGERGWRDAGAGGGGDGGWWVYSEQGRASWWGSVPGASTQYVSMGPLPLTCHSSSAGDDAQSHTGGGRRWPWRGGNRRLRRPRRGSATWRRV